MKNLNQYITEYIIKKKLDKPIDSEHNYKYFPKSKEELIENIKELISKRKYNFNCIDTSEITDMKSLFANEKQLRDVNFNVSEWNVSNVRTMAFMFANCKKFDCDLSDWNMSNVTHTNYMFDNCQNFTGKGLDKLDVSNVVDFGAFVDIGLHEDGLFHISKMANHRIHHPSEVVAVGDIVTVWVYRIDEEKGKVQLSLVQPR